MCIMNVGFYTTDSISKYTKYSADFEKKLGWLVGFYGTSMIVSYLKLNPL